MLVGDQHIPDAPEDHEKFLDWYMGDLAAAGAAFLADDRAASMCFDGRPVTNLEMMATHAALLHSWTVAADEWIKCFENMLNQKTGDDQ